MAQPDYDDVMRPNRCRSHFYPFWLAWPQYLLNQNMEHMLGIKILSAKASTSTIPHFYFSCMDLSCIRHFHANFHIKYNLRVYSGSLIIYFTTVTVLRLVTLLNLCYLLFVREVLTNAPFYGSLLLWTTKEPVF